MSEQRRLSLVRRLLARGHPETVLDIGDDAAVLRAPGEPVVVSVDVQVEGVHFDRRWLSLHDVGYRATMAAFSDLAAMCAEPLAALGSLVLPRQLTDAELTELVTGQRDACDALGSAIVGGNLAQGSALSVTTTVLGRGSQLLSRAGARPGDELWLCGEVGLAAAGLTALRDEHALSAAALRPCLQAWRRPFALIEAGRHAARFAHAAIDISDGLALDAARMASASGCAFELDAAQLVSQLLHDAAAALGGEPLDWALHGGEDYALLVALPAGAGDALVAGEKPQSGHAQDTSAGPSPGAGAWQGARRIGRCVELADELTERAQAAAAEYGQAEQEQAQAERAQEAAGEYGQAEQEQAQAERAQAGAKAGTDAVSEQALVGRLWLVRDGERSPLQPGGYQHFRDDPRA